MKKSRIKGIALFVALTLVVGCLPAFAYNAQPSEATGNMDGIEMAKEVAIEGMVLLKNDDVNGKPALPLEFGDKVAVFGINQVDFIYGGGGSGNFNSQNERVGYVSLYDAMKTKEAQGVVSVYGDMASKYRAYYDNYWANDARTYAYGTRQGAVIMFGGEMEVSQSEANAAANAAKTAIITIGRPAGEDGDRSNSAGDFKLSDKEKTLINRVEAAGFEKIVVVLNVTGIIESDWMKDDSIDAVLLASLPGMDGGDAMADVLLGYANPSGRLTDTWAGDYWSYPSSSNFGNSSYVNHAEDIFVGYRYFETIPGKSASVNFPFGFGLSYSDFEITGTSVIVEGTGRNRTVTARATVTNNGDFPGKEVVQVYVGIPETTLPQSKKRLVGFYKTKELSRGESENVTISFPFDDMASFDDTGRSGYEAAYVVERGKYEFYIGSNVRDCTSAGSFSLNSTERVQQLSHHLVPDTTKFNSRLTSKGTYETIPATTNAPASGNPETDVEAAAKKAYTDEATKLLDKDNFITFPELAAAFADGESEEDTALLRAFVARLTDDEATRLVGCVEPTGAGHRTGIGGLGIYGMPTAGTTNGPAGIQYNGSQSTWETTSTFYPCATMQAQTWNVELVEQLGAAIADEAQHFGLDVWQAPGMNIHRNPLCGRNFEYFSEDPLLTGKIAVAITNGVQNRKFAAQIKHFAMNNQELGRWDGVDSRVSERALREIYLKGYEIAIKEANPWSVMSSYNRLNGTRASENHELLTEVLRNEWGYDGFVMTDFYTAPTHLDELLAGGDLKAPANRSNPSLLMTALSDGRLQSWQVKRSAERIVRYLLRTQDAADLAGSSVNYQIVMQSGSESFSVDEKIHLKENVTWETFLNSLVGYYGYSYTLTDKYGTVLTDPDTPLAVGMSVKVVAEDGVTQKTYEVTGNSLARNKTSKASYEESSSYSAAKAFDGDMTTRWSGFEGNYIWDHWVEVDLGGEYHITSVDLSYYKGNERVFNYEIYTAPATSAGYWSDKNKSRNFISQGYTQAARGSASYTALESAAVDQTARFVAVKTTGGVGGICATLWEVEVYGWRLESDEYTIDEANRRVTVWQDDTDASIARNLRVAGVGELSIDSAAGEITVTDQNGKKTVYTISRDICAETKLSPVGENLVDNDQKKIVVTDRYTADEISLAVESRYNAALELVDRDRDGYITKGDVIHVTAEDGTTTADYDVLSGMKNDYPLDAVATYTQSGDYAASNACDGDFATRWSAYGGGMPQAIMIDMYYSTGISAIKTYWYGDSRTNTYDIYVTDTPTIVNGTFKLPSNALSLTNRYTEVSHGTARATGEGVIDILGLRGQYVTVYCRQNSANIANIWEIEIYKDDEHFFDAYKSGAKVTLKSSIEGEFYAGAYNKDGALLKVISLRDGTATVNDPRIAYVKAFYWEDIRWMTPMLPCETKYFR